MKAPTANDKGSFETVLLLVSDNWPYALPNLYAINVVSDPGMTITGWTTSPDGENVARNAFTLDRSKVESIGFWHGKYKIIEIKMFLSNEKAEQSAKELFANIPTKYLMQNGKIVEESEKIQITGDWPTDWKFLQIRDIGVFLCYLQELLNDKKEYVQVQKLRNSITPGWPPTEQILVFHNSLNLAKKELASSFDNRTKKLIDNALNVIEHWLKGR